MRLFDRSTRHVALDARRRATSRPRRGACSTSSTARVAGCTTAPRGAAAASRSRCCRRSPRAGCRRAGALPRRAIRASTLEVADVLSEACIERVRRGRPISRSPRSRAETPGAAGRAVLRRRLPPRLPRRPSAGDARAALRAARPRAPGPSSTCRAPAACASTSTRRCIRSRCDTVIEVDQLATVMGMVRAGLGISVVPALTLFHFRQPEIATRPVRLPGLTRRIYLVRRRDRSLSVAAQALHDLVLAHRPTPAPPAEGAHRRAAARPSRPGVSSTSSRTERPRCQSAP